jgi:AhpD family alkylhydroperoxidase
MLEAPRLQLTDMPQEPYRHLLQLEGLIVQHIDLTLYHLIKLRASQLNGCAYCLEMHTDEALRHGEKPERLTALGGWHESPLYTDKERAALKWTDEVTLIADKHASRAAYDELKGQFSDAEIPWLILAVVQINSWNRIAISTRAQFERAPAIAVKTPEPV